MRPFNLEKAADGQPVMTKSGLPARIICVDANNPWEGIGENLCVVALVEDNGFEQLHRYNEKGEYRSVNKDHGGRAVITTNSNLDLVMETQKLEGWINVYAYPDGSRSGSTIHETEEDAKEVATGNVVDTIKIEWEE